MREFTEIGRIARNFRETVDELVPGYLRGLASDEPYNDETKARRRAERDAGVNAQISDAAERAQNAALVELGKLQDRLTAWIAAPTDTALLQQLQAFQILGVELSPREVDAFHERAKGNYVALRLLAPMSKGAVPAPRLETFENQLKELKSDFGLVAHYRGPNSELVPEDSVSGSGTSNPLTMAVIGKGILNKFDEKLTKFSGAWAYIER